jgi:hypothetical protein
MEYKEYHMSNENKHDEFNQAIVNLVESFESHLNPPTVGHWLIYQGAFILEHYRKTASKEEVFDIINYAINSAFETSKEIKENHE